MIKRTFQNEVDYLDFVQNIQVFTHLRAYNASAYLWKKEDMPYVSKIRDVEYREEHFEEWKHAMDVWTKAEKEYGNDVTFWRDIFEHYSDEILLRSFGFKYPEPDDDGDELSIEESVNITLGELEKNDAYPTTFPCVLLLENGNEYDGPNIEFVYMDDFQKESIKLDFGWLKENVLNFWVNGEGNYYGN